MNTHKCFTLNTHYGYVKPIDFVNCLKKKKKKRKELSFDDEAENKNTKRRRNKYARNERIKIHYSATVDRFGTVFSGTLTPSRVAPPKFAYSNEKNKNKIMKKFAIHNSY